MRPRALTNRHLWLRILLGRRWAQVVLVWDRDTGLWSRGCLGAQCLHPTLRVLLQWEMCGLMQGCGATAEGALPDEPAALHC